MRQLALQMKELFEALSPFLERHTRRVCPQCQEPCCKVRHGRAEEADLVFFAALGVVAPWAQGPEDAPCSYLGPQGCGLRRWQRPYRCTWYFCQRLLRSMAGEGRAYREFVQRLQRLAELRRQLLHNGRHY
jgi:hypothetical protein